MFKKWQRIIAAVLVVTFLHQDLVWAQGGDPVWSKPAKHPTSEVYKPESDIPTSEVGWSIPRDLAVTKEVFNSPKPNTQYSIPNTIINIQDAHASLSAQQSIAAILDSLVTNYDLKLVAIEGSSGYIDTSILKTFPDESIRKKTAQHLMSQGKMSAGEFFAITSSKPIALYGIEDRPLYNENLDQFRKIYDLNLTVSKNISDLQTALNELKDKIYSDDLKTLDNNSVLHKDGKIGFTQRWGVVERLAKKTGLVASRPSTSLGTGQSSVVSPGYPNLNKLIEALKQEKSISFDKANKERDALIDVLSKKINKPTLENLVLKSLAFKQNKISQGEYYVFLEELAQREKIEPSPFSDLIAYTDYSTLYESIDLLEIFNEVESLEAAVKEKLFVNDYQRRLDKISSCVSYLKDLFNIRLTGQDLQRLSEGLKYCDAEYIAGFIKDASLKYDIPIEGGYDLSRIFDSATEAIEFYKTADRRNSAMLANTINRMNENGETVAALITGGYHTKGISELLKQKETSYLVLLPKFDASKGERPYVAILTNKKAPYENLLKTGEYYIAIGAYFEGIRQAKTPEDIKLLGKQLEDMFEFAAEEFAAGKLGEAKVEAMRSLVAMWSSNYKTYWEKAERRPGFEPMSCANFEELLSSFTRDAGAKPVDADTVFTIDENTPPEYLNDAVEQRYAEIEKAHRPDGTTVLPEGFLNAAGNINVEEISSSGGNYTVTAAFWRGSYRIDTKPPSIFGVNEPHPAGYCRLCANKLPKEEVLFRVVISGKRYTVAVNKNIFMNKHLLLIAENPLPQDLEGSFRDGCFFARAIGADYEGFYSSPGPANTLHHHFQFGKRKSGLFKKLDSGEIKVKTVRRVPDMEIGLLENWYMKGILLESADFNLAQAEVDDIVKKLKQRGVYYTVLFSVKDGRVRAVVVPIKNPMPSSLKAIDPDGLIRIAGYEAGGDFIACTEDVYRKVKANPQSFIAALREASYDETESLVEAASPQITIEEAARICGTFNKHNVVLSFSLDASKKRDPDDSANADVRKGLERIQAIFSISQVKAEHFYEDQCRDQEEVDRITAQSLYSADGRTLHLKTMVIPDAGPCEFDLCDPRIAKFIADEKSFLYQTVQAMKPEYVGVHLNQPLKGCPGSDPLSRDEAMDRIVGGINKLHENLKKAGHDRPILVESRPWSRARSASPCEYIADPEFIREVLQRTGAHLLVDCAHVRISAKNRNLAHPTPGFDFMRDYVEKIVNKDTIGLVDEVHLVGVKDYSDGEEAMDAHLPFYTDNQTTRDVKRIFRYIVELRAGLGITKPLIVNFETDIANSYQEMSELADALNAISISETDLPAPASEAAANAYTSGVSDKKRALPTPEVGQAAAEPPIAGGEGPGGLELSQELARAGETLNRAANVLGNLGMKIDEKDPLAPVIPAANADLKRVKIFDGFTTKLIIAGIIFFALGLIGPDAGQADALAALGFDLTGFDIPYALSLGIQPGSAGGIQAVLMILGSASLLLASVFAITSYIKEQISQADRADKAKERLSKGIEDVRRIMSQDANLARFSGLLKNIPIPVVGKYSDAKKAGEPLMGTVIDVSIMDLLDSARHEVEGLGNSVMTSTQKYELLRIGRAGPRNIFDRIWRRITFRDPYQGAELEIYKLYRALKMAEVTASIEADIYMSREPSPSLQLFNEQIEAVKEKHRKSLNEMIEHNKNLVRRGASAYRYPLYTLWVLTTALFFAPFLTAIVFAPYLCSYISTYGPGNGPLGGIFAALVSFFLAHSWILPVFINGMLLISLANLIYKNFYVSPAGLFFGREKLSLDGRDKIVRKGVVSADNEEIKEAMLRVRGSFVEEFMARHPGDIAKLFDVTGTEPKVLTAGEFIDLLLSPKNLYKKGENANAPPRILAEEFFNLPEVTKQFPDYTILLPAFGEPEVIEELIDTIANLIYPADKLQIILLPEASDSDKRKGQNVSTLELIRAKLTSDPKKYNRFEVLTSQARLYPEHNQSKPYSTNYALGITKGKYLVIYDAEDRPYPLQIVQAALGFEKRGAFLKNLIGYILQKKITAEEVDRADAFRLDDPLLYIKAREYRFDIGFIIGLINERSADMERGRFTSEVAAEYSERKPLGILQAPLTWYNPVTMTATQFIIDYAAWFGIFLPGLVAKNLPVSQGGTSNHFLVDALKKVGGWDPHNVTEDAQIAIDIQLAGYDSLMLDSITAEEAPARQVTPEKWHWIRQHSRWGKGFIQVTLVLIRNLIHNPIGMYEAFGLRGIISMLFLFGVGTYSYLFYTASIVVSILWGASNLIALGPVWSIGVMLGVLAAITVMMGTTLTKVFSFTVLIVGFNLLFKNIVNTFANYYLTMVPHALPIIPWLAANGGTVVPLIFVSVAVAITYMLARNPGPESVLDIYKKEIEAKGLVKTYLKILAIFGAGIALGGLFILSVGTPVHPYFIGLALLFLPILTDMVYNIAAVKMGHSYRDFALEVTINELSSRQKELEKKGGPDAKEARYLAELVSRLKEDDGFYERMLYAAAILMPIYRIFPVLSFWIGYTQLLLGMASYWDKTKKFGRADVEIKIEAKDISSFKRINGVLRKVNHRFVTIPLPGLNGTFRLEVGAVAGAALVLVPLLFAPIRYGRDLINNRKIVLAQSDLKKAREDLADALSGGDKDAKGAAAVRYYNAIHTVYRDSPEYLKGHLKSLVEQLVSRREYPISEPEIKLYVTAYMEIVSARGAGSEEEISIFIEELKETIATANAPGRKKTSLERWLINLLGNKQPVPDNMPAWFKPIFGDRAKAIKELGEARRGTFKHPFTYRSAVWAGFITKFLGYSVMAAAAAAYIFIDHSELSKAALGFGLMFGAYSFLAALRYNDSYIGRAIYSIVMNLGFVPMEARKISPLGKSVYYAMIGASFTPSQARVTPIAISEVPYYKHEDELLSTKISKERKIEILTDISKGMLTPKQIEAFAILLSERPEAARLIIIHEMHKRHLIGMLAILPIVDRLLNPLSWRNRIEPYLKIAVQDRGLSVRRAALQIMSVDTIVGVIDAGDIGKKDALAAALDKTDSKIYVLKVSGEDELTKLAKEIGMPAILVDLPMEELTKENIEPYVRAVKKSADSMKYEHIQMRIVNGLAGIEELRAILQDTLAAKPAGQFTMEDLIKLREAIPQRRDVIRAVYNSEDIDKIAKGAVAANPGIALALTEELLENDIFASENAGKEIANNIPYAFIYGIRRNGAKAAQDEDEAKACLKLHGYSDNAIARISLIDGGNRSYQEIVMAIAQANPTVDERCVGIRALEGELTRGKDDKGVLFEIKTLDVGGKHLYVTINSEQALLKVLSQIKPETATLADMALPPGVYYNREKGVLIYLSPIVPKNYGEEYETYRNATALIRSAA